MMNSHFYWYLIMQKRQEKITQFCLSSSLVSNWIALCIRRLSIRFEILFSIKIKRKKNRIRCCSYWVQVRIRYCIWHWIGKAIRRTQRESFIVSFFSNIFCFSLFFFSLQLTFWTERKFNFPWIRYHSVRNFHRKLIFSKNGLAAASGSLFRVNY